MNTTSRSRPLLLVVSIGAIGVSLTMILGLLLARGDLLLRLVQDPAVFAEIDLGGRTVARLVFGLLLSALALMVLAWPQRARTVLSNYFGATGHPLNLAVFRIALFSFMLWLVNLQELLFFSGLPAELRLPPLGLGWLPALVPFQPALIAAAVAVYRTACVMAIVGLFTRSSALIVLLTGFYLIGIPQFYGKVNHYHHLIWFTALLALSRSGDALAIDGIRAAWRRADRGDLQPPGAAQIYALPIRFVWLLMGLIYFFPGFWKLWASGFNWALTDNLRNHMYAKWFELGSWTPGFRIDQYPLFYKSAAFGTLVFEIGFIFFIFFSFTRRLVAVGGLVFHTMTNYFMRISFFALQLCYITFFDWHKLSRRIGAFLFRDDLYVLYDGNCRRCRRTIASLRAIDIFERITYVNALDQADLDRHRLDHLDPVALATDMHAVRGGRVWMGYEAYRQLLRRIPLCWPLLPLMYVAPVQRLGERVYRNVADTRLCEVAPAAQAAPAHLRRGPLAGIAVLGGLLLAFNGGFGMARISAAWPFACYPTFHSLRPAEIEQLVIEMQTRDGETVAVSGNLFGAQTTTERWQGLLRNTLNMKDQQEITQRLAALWRVAARNDPSLADIRHATFYNVSRSTLPEQRAAAALSSEKLAELTIDDLTR